MSPVLDVSSSFLAVWSDFPACGHARTLSLAGAATSIIFVAQKVYMCRQKFICVTKNLYLSRQTRACRDKTRLVSRQKYPCRDKTFVATKDKYLSWQKCFVATNYMLVATKVFSLHKRKWYLWQLPPMIAPSLPDGLGACMSTCSEVISNCKERWWNGENRTVVLTSRMSSHVHSSPKVKQL